MTDLVLDERKNGWCVTDIEGREVSPHSYATWQEAQAWLEGYESGYQEGLDDERMG